MSSLAYQMATLLTCQHRAYDGAWPSHVPFSIAEDSAARYAAPAWRIRWNDGTAFAATCVETNNEAAPLCLWSGGTDASFWMASALPESVSSAAAAKGPQVLVAQATPAASAAFSLLDMTPLRVRAPKTFSAKTELEPLDRTPIHVPLDGAGYADLSCFGPGLYRWGRRASWFYASDLALRRRPSLVIVVSVRALSECLQGDRKPTTISVDARSTFWRYFVFSKYWSQAAGWSITAREPSAKFGAVSKPLPGDAFEVKREDGIPWVVFPQGQRALGFISRKPLAYRLRPDLYLSQGDVRQRVSLPAPPLVPSTFSRAGVGTAQTLCSDAFIHL